MPFSTSSTSIRRIVLATALLAASWAYCAVVAAQTPGKADLAVLKAAADHRVPYLADLKSLVEFETGSRDTEGINQATAWLAERFKSLGAQVELVEPVEANTYRMIDTPDKIGRMVKATFTGTGSKTILLIAHLDTVYTKGMVAQQPFRIDGNKAYGLGIADDKQGVAMVLHVASMLKSIGFAGFGKLTVLVNSDEEISSPGSREVLAREGAAHDAVMSFEATGLGDAERVSLATAGIAAVELKIEGRASHAGSAPERGVNALYELSHQIMQMRDMSVPSTGVKLNWTVAQSGVNRNVIPAHATAFADVRVLKVSDYDGIEAAVRERVKKQLLPESKITVNFERRRPPLEVVDANRKLAAQVQAVYAELGRTLAVGLQAEGGGTDAAFAALRTKAPVIERMGLQGFGAHSNSSEYVLLDTLEPRLYLAARMVMDLSKGLGL
jgi:glutamate carboxypeptidase